MQGTVQAGEEDHARPGWTTSRHGQDSVGYAFIAQSQISVAFHSVMIANLTAYRGGYISVLDMFIALKFIGQCCTCGKKTPWHIAVYFCNGMSMLQCAVISVCIAVQCYHVLVAHTIHKHVQTVFVFIMFVTRLWCI